LEHNKNKQEYKEVMSDNEYITIDFLEKKREKWRKEGKIIDHYPI
jgi:hypothetical protein